MGTSVDFAIQVDLRECHLQDVADLRRPLLHILNPSSLRNCFG
jgi:hypothetical protein